MPNSRDFRRMKSIPDLIADQRKPRILPETGWYRIAATQNYEALGVGGQFVSTITHAVFRSSWRTYDSAGTTHSPVGWYLSEHGEVRFRGKITGGAVGTVVAYLPEEIRPEFAETFIVATDQGGSATITIWPNGSMIVDSIG